ncbi:MAG: hypothetical protein RLZZ511_383 [Cyanobacteriota bacterium]|jgi:SAM-dependent methyltransferase/uncharacterized protein YbaR (Trm112 family)
MPVMFTADFCCVQCGKVSLIQQTELFNCASCGANYPIVHDVPIFFPDVTIELVDPGDEHEALAVSICEYQNLPQDQETIDTVSSIFSKTYRFADALLDAESQQYIDRVKNTKIRNSQPQHNHAQTLIQLLKQRLKTFAKRTFPPAVLLKLKRLTRKTLVPRTSVPSITVVTQSLELQYEWVLDYLPRQMAVSQGFTGNVRVKNIGFIPISSQGDTPIMMAYHWYRSSGERCDEVVEHRTPFPIELQPGREITLPLLMDTPIAPAHYELELCLIQEHVAWHETGAIRIPIEILAVAPPDPTQQWDIQTIDHYDYADDHHHALELLKNKLATGSRPHPKVLEIGGNASPMLFYDVPGILYNLDIDVQGLQVGHLVGQAMQKNVTFLCADAYDIPFADEYFDCITIFASLHHFPDLRVILRSLAQKIHAQGFLAIMCEPVGHLYGEGFYPLFIEELLKGVNEQSFSLAEYAAIFEEAGLVVDDIVIHGGSLKAFLKKKII